MNYVTISVIIPVYNSEKFLHKCVDSVLSQTYQDFELLLINDGSKDLSGGICDAYAVNDCRVRVFHKENGGVSSARNTGLDNAQGEWICFVDSDDWVDENYLESLLKDSLEFECDFVIHGDLGKHCAEECLKLNKDVSTNNIASEVFEKLKISQNGYPFSKLFKSSIINKHKIRFPLNINLNEDTLFIIQYVSKCSIIYFRSILNYNYIDDNEGSLSNKKFLDYSSSSLAFQKINNILINDFRISDISSYPTLRSTVLMFLYNSLRAMYKNNFTLKRRRICYNELYNSSNVTLGHEITPKGLLLSLFLMKQFWMIDILLSFIYKTSLNSIYVRFKRRK